MFGVMLARLAGMVSGVRRMTVRRMSVVRGLFMGVGLVMLGCLAVVLGGVLMMLGCGGVMLDDPVFGHGDLLRVGVAAGSAGATLNYPKRTLLHGSDRPMSQPVDRWTARVLSPA
jgi:hypothetical protein